MRIQKIYLVKRKFNQLRVKIDGRAYRCGQTVKGHNCFIQRIEASGSITLQSHDTGERHDAQALVSVKNDIGLVMH